MNRVLLSGLALGMTASASMLVNCASDPRSGDKVTVIDTCNVAQLSTTPSSPEASLRSYLEAADQLLARANAVEAEIRDACNAMDTDLKLATGSDAVTACKPIGARVDALGKASPVVPPGTPFWGELRFAKKCTTNPKAYLDCVSACTPSCDVSKCEAGKVTGTCAGTCKGSCVTTSDQAAPCTGACIGEVAIPGAPTTCSGECTGICTGPEWSGTCEGACVGEFRGICGGTCTGKCNGAPINVAPASDGGADAGPPPPGGPPNNADGNCAGTCEGICSSKGNGYCKNSPCLDFTKPGPPGMAAFSGGDCTTGLCAGTCRSGNGTGSTTTCKGQCTAKQEQCAGTCVGECDGTRANAQCEGALACGQNAECENACEAKRNVATTCTEPDTLEVYGVTDPELAATFQKNGAKLGRALSELANLRAALGFIGDRAYGDFANIGLSGDHVRACVKQGNKAVADADAKIRASIQADPSVRRF